MNQQSAERVREVTERRALEQKLRESEARYRTLVETSSSIVWTNDPKGALTGRIPMWEAITGQPLEEYLIGDSWLAVVHPDDRQRMGDAWERALRVQEPLEVEYRVRGRDGHFHWILSRAAPVRDESGNVQEWVGAATDINDRKQAEEALQRAHTELELRVDEQTRALRQANQALRALSQCVLNAQENERRRIARELHDEIGQLLTGLKMMVEMSGRRGGTGAREAPGARRTASEMKAITDVIDEALTRVRELALDLRPAILDSLGLLPGLLWLFERYSNQTGIHVEFHHGGLDRRLAPELEVGLFRLVQEALTNVARHAYVTTAEVHLVTSAHLLEVSITDRGRGFEVQAAERASVSSGLASMHERAALLGGRLTITSFPGEGTAVVANLPISYASAAEPDSDSMGATT